VLHNSESSEMYLETIYILESNHGHAHIVDIAKQLGVTKPSVTKAMDQFKKQDLIRQETYGPVTLTEKGRAVSRKIYRKHQLIAQYLEKSLGLDPDEASENACRMEHSITGDMLKAIEKYLEDETQK
jgi:DtxR family transcriptional regulator, Mn-dependent transcriptional regulator